MDRVGWEGGIPAPFASDAASAFPSTVDGRKCLVKCVCYGLELAVQCNLPCIRDVRFFGCMIEDF
jgi:hypothetical protein